MTEEVVWVAQREISVFRRSMPPRPVVDGLWVERVKLCDLLWGRKMRSRARLELQTALSMEELGAPCEDVTRVLERAAHMEWIARVTEFGQVLWGERYDRQGRRPEDVEGERA